MGRHKLFAQTSWNGITVRQVQSLAFKSFARGGNAHSVGYDQEHSSYLLGDPLLEAVKSAKYIKSKYKLTFTEINPPISFDKIINIHAKRGFNDIEPAENQETNTGEKLA